MTNFYINKVKNCVIEIDPKQGVFVYENIKVPELDSVEEKQLDQGVPMKKKRGRQPGFSPKKKLGRPKKEIDTSPVFTGGPVVDADAKKNLQEMIQKFGRTSVHKVIDGHLKGDDVFTLSEFAGVSEEDVELIIEKCV